MAKQTVLYSVTIEGVFEAELGSSDRMELLRETDRLVELIRAFINTDPNRICTDIEMTVGEDWHVRHYREWYARKKQEGVITSMMTKS